MARTKTTFRRARAQRARRMGTQPRATQSSELPAAAAAMPPHEQCQDEAVTHRVDEAVTQCVNETVTQCVDEAVTQCADEAVTQCEDETHSNTPTKKPADIALALETVAVQPVLSSTPRAVSAQQQHKKKRKVSSAE